MDEGPPYTYDYPRPMVMVDAVVLDAGPPVRVLLVRRKHDPYAGRWALPGGFVEMDETLDDAVARELFEETGIEGVPLEQFHTFGDPGRDPRGRAVSVAYRAFVRAGNHIPRAADDAADAAWMTIEEAGDLAFDHDAILERALASGEPPAGEG